MKSAIHLPLVKRCKSAHRNRLESPYLALLPHERSVIVAGILVIVTVSGMSSIISDEGLQPLVYGAFLIYVIVFSLPLFTGFLRTPAFFHPLFFYGAWSGFQSLLTGKAVLGANGLDFHRALPGMSRDSLELVAAHSFLLDALALISLYLGFGLLRNLPTRRYCTPRPPRHLALAAVLWMALPASAVAVLAAEAGGVSSLLLQRGIASDQRIQAVIGGHWYLLAGFGTVVPVVWLAFQRNATRNLIFWGVALLSASLNFMATGSRGSTIAPLVLIVFMWALQHRSIPYRALGAVAAIAILLVGLLGEFRVATRGVSTLDAVEVQANALSGLRAGHEELVQGNMSNDGQLAVLGSVPEQVGYLWGESYLSIPFVFIPSQLWPGETPSAAGKLNAAYIYGNPLSGIPTGAVGEAYWNFSHAGVVSVFLIFGCLLRYAASLYKANPRHPLIITIYLYTIVLLLPGSNQIYNFFHALTPVIGFYLLVRLLDRVRLKGVSASRVIGVSTKD